MPATTPGCVSWIAAEATSPAPRGTGALREPEVHHLDDAVAPDHDVLRLDVAVDDAAAVRRGKRRGDLGADVHEFAHRQRAARGETLAQRHAVHELRRDEVDRARLPDLVDRDDVRMVERRGGARFLLEAAAEIGVVVQRRRQHFQRDVATEHGVGRAVDIAHPARPEVRDDLIAIDLPADERRPFGAGDPIFSHALAELLQRDRRRLGVSGNQ